MPGFFKRYADFVARLRVPSGFLLVAAFIWLADPTAASIAWGTPLGIAGLALRAWAAGHLEKNASLAISGPYAFIRNPLYLGTLTVAAGVAIAARRVELAVLFAAVFGLVYFPVIELEQQHLRKLFPAYAEYSRLVPLLLPRGRRMRSERPFQFRLYRKNEEYNAALGWMAGMALLLWKALSK
jgi:protein-S-isoprenylcysteine O-methyltransferase Ste14